MIKATDLMIGDWVQIVPTAPVMPNEYHRIDWIRTGEIGFDNRKIVTYPYIQPIPLTPEILEKNGFDYMGNCHYDYEVGYGQLVRYDTFNRRLKIIRDLDIIFDSGDYAELMLHELQHALKLCGIDKKITL